MANEAYSAHVEAYRQFLIFDMRREQVRRYCERLKAKMLA